MRGFRFIGMFLAMSFLAASAQASMIGVNFVGTGASLGASESTGVAAQINWNNVTGGSGTNVALYDDSGTATTATVTYVGHGPAASGSSQGTSTERLLSGFIYSYYCEGAQPPGAVQCVVTMNNIPVAFQGSGYDLYIYIDPNRYDTADQEITLDGITNWYDRYVPSHSDFVEVTSNDGSNPTEYGNYIHVSGLTASSFTFTCQTDPDTGYVSTPGVYGFQIVQVPEPATMSLIGIGGLGLLLRRKR